MNWNKREIYVREPQQQYANVLPVVEWPVVMRGDSTYERDVEVSVVQAGTINNQNGEAAEVGEIIDLKQLAHELVRIRTAYTLEAHEPEQYFAIGAISAAEAAATNGDEIKAFEYLKHAGKHTFEIATRIEAPLTAKIIAEFKT